MKLYVGNLPWSVDDSALKELFSSYNPEEAVLIKDKYSGRSKGFGFLTMSDDESAKKAISEMNGKEVEGRALTVSEARPMVPRDSGSGYAGDSEESSDTEEASEETSNKDAPETADEAVEDAKSDEPAAEEAPKEEAEESTEKESKDAE